MNFTREHMPRCKDEVEAIVKGYWESTQAGKDQDPIVFKWDLYEELDKRGRILFLTCRDQDTKKMYGFVSYFIAEHMHHDHIMATCDMLSVVPDMRGRGIGSELVKQAEQWLKAQGITHIVHAYRLIYGDTPLFPKLGYKAEETWYVKDMR